MKLGSKLLIIGAAAVAIILSVLFLTGRLSLINIIVKPVVDKDVSNYSMYMGDNAKEEYRSKWGMDETIFPTAVTAAMDAEDYTMVYYNPYDAQYLSYLVVNYDSEAYADEVQRLQSVSSTPYKGNYGATGFGEEYKLLAMYADSSYGFVYALTDGQNKIIYVEIIFCNYFMDIDYTKYIDSKYLPIGFDASKGNAYRREKLHKG